jgi:hypothetical protein
MNIGNDSVYYQKDTFYCRLFERKLAEQQATLLRLNRDLTNSNAQRIDRDERCAQLEIENVQHLTEIARLESANAVGCSIVEHKLIITLLLAVGTQRT